MNGVDIFVVLISFIVDVSYYMLDNGLCVVLFEDYIVLIVIVVVYYGVGFCNELCGCIGFVYLFEYFMFQGLCNFLYGVFDMLIYGLGGVNNGFIWYDFINYFEVVLFNVLEVIIWVEVDCMGQLNLDESQLDNQCEVVCNEVFVNVINQFYGGWIWIDLLMVVNENWYNVYNFYGDLIDFDVVLLEDVQVFFDQFYVLNNVVIVVVGDIDKGEIFGWIEQYFFYIEVGDLLLEIDIFELCQEEEKFDYIEDNLVNQLVFVVGYYMLECGMLEYYVMILIDQLLVQGDDSCLIQFLVSEEGYVFGVFGGINFLGNVFNYFGFMLWMVGLIYDSEFIVFEVMGMMDIMIEGICIMLVIEVELECVCIKLFLDFYGMVDIFMCFGLVDLLVFFVMFDDDLSCINWIMEGFEQVILELVMSMVQEYLCLINCIVLEVCFVGDDSQ